MPSERTSNAKINSCHGVIMKLLNELPRHQLIFWALKGKPEWKITFDLGKERYMVRYYKNGGSVSHKNVYLYYSSSNLIRVDKLCYCLHNWKVNTISRQQNKLNFIHSISTYKVDVFGLTMLTDYIQLQRNIAAIKLNTSNVFEMT